MLIYPPLSFEFCILQIQRAFLFLFWIKRVCCNEHRLSLITAISWSIPPGSNNKDIPPPANRREKLVSQKKKTWAVSSIMCSGGNVTTNGVHRNKLASLKTPDWPQGLCEMHINKAWTPSSDIVHYPDVQSTCNSILTLLAGSSGCLPQRQWTYGLPRKLSVNMCTRSTRTLFPITWTWCIGACN